MKRSSGEKAPLASNSRSHTFLVVSWRRGRPTMWRRNSSRSSSATIRFTSSPPYGSINCTLSSVKISPHPFTLVCIRASSVSRRPCRSQQTQKVTPGLQVRGRLFLARPHESVVSPYEVPRPFEARDIRRGKGKFPVAPEEGRADLMRSRLAVRRLAARVRHQGVVPKSEAGRGVVPVNEHEFAAAGQHAVLRAWVAVCERGRGAGGGHLQVAYNYRRDARAEFCLFAAPAPQPVKALAALQ